MFDLNRGTIGRLYRRFRSNMYIPVYHTNGRSIKKYDRHGSESPSGYGALGMTLQ